MALTLRAASTSIFNILLSTAVLVFACTTNYIFNIILILCIFAFIIMALKLASASTSSSSSARSNYRYDVFINHRGEDVKKTFASHLYHRLLCAGLQVFLDQPEMQRGETINPQIEGAVESASVQVAIFSPRYAESSWCLDELVLMMKSMESGAATVIPVFFKVKPSELRRTNAGADGFYAQALDNHEKKKRYNHKRIAGWREALAKASAISGFELEACNGDVGQLLDAVLQQVIKARKAPFHGATYPVGLGEKLLDIETMVLLEEQHDRAGPKFVGIVGPGGVGKTTLAKLFFNAKKRHYERSCFLAEARDAAARRTFPSHQRKLYQDLTGSDPPICSSTDEGIPIFKRLRSSQALIILDDVDGLEQLEALFLPIKDVLPAGSLVLLTTRNKDVLTKYARLEESNIYNMTGLNLEHSQELFCWHAFHYPYPVVGYENLVRELLKGCQGLPLSLEVIGSLLREAWLRSCRNTKYTKD